MKWGEPGKMSALPPPPPSKTLDSKRTSDSINSGDSKWSVGYEVVPDSNNPIDYELAAKRAKQLMSFQRRDDDLRDISVPKETPINNNTLRDMNIKLDKILDILEKSFGINHSKKKSHTRKAKSVPKSHTRKAKSAPKPHTRKAKSLHARSTRRSV